MPEIITMKIKNVDSVDAPSNKRKFLLVKSDDPKEGGENTMADELTLEEALEKIQEPEVREFIQKRLEDEKNVEPSEGDDVKKNEGDGEGNEDVKKGSDEGTDVKIDKSALPEEVAATLKKMENELEATKKLVKAEREKRLDMEFQKKAEPYKNLAKVDTVASVLRKAHEAGIDDELEEIFRAANERIDVSKIENPEGDKGADSTDVNSKLEKRVKEIQSNDPDISEAQAIVKAVEEDPNLYTEYLDNRG